MPRREGAYRVYLGVAVGLVAVAPLVRMLFLALMEPAAIAWLNSSDFTGQLRVLGALVLPLGLLAGTVRGPALLSPFETVTLGSNHLPRRVTLRRSFLRSLLVAVAAAMALAVLPAAALVVGGGGSPLAAVSAVVGAAALAGVGLVLALVGQIVRTRWAWCLAILLVLAGVSPFGAGAWFASSWTQLAALGSRAGDGSVAVSGPGGGVGLWSAAASGGALTGTLCLMAVAIAALVLVPRLLDRLRGDLLLLQARRREMAAMSVASGELSGAAASYREEPSTGRKLRAVVGGPRVLSMLVRDAVGALRTPQRTVLGALALGLAAVLVGAATGPAGGAWTAGPVAAAVAVGGVAMFAALGSFADGFRHAADAAVGAATFGTPVGEQFVLHAAFPVVIVILVVGIVALSTGGGLAPVLVGLAMIAVRAFEAARGHLPPLLLTPMPSEVGDLSVIARLAWQFDSVILAAGLGLAITSLWVAGAPVPSVLVLVAGTILLALATRSRLRHGRV